MNFDLILHGKPNAGSHKATNGLDGMFCQNLVDNFFQSMDNIKDPQVLIVDARNWKGTWYSVYTFWLGKNITDTANRTSFLAISMVVPKQYVCLVSAVYNSFSKICKDYVIGTFINNNGKYIVQDFNDNVAFEKLYDLLKNDLVNLAEDFDSSFKQHQETVSNCYYNFIDCDSKAFVEDLKKNGRVFVTTTFDSKDARLVNTNKYFRELEVAKGELTTKDSEIKKLSQQIKELEDQISAKNNRESGSINTLNTEVATLTQENTTLKSNLSSLNDSISKYEETRTKIVQLLGAKFVGQNVQDKTKQFDNENNNPKPFKVKNVFPLINTVLLILLLLTTSFKGCGSGISELASFADSTSLDELKNENEELKVLIKQKDDQIKLLSNHTTSDYDEYGLEEYGSDQNLTDVSCGLDLYQDGKPIKNSSEIELSKELTIHVRQQQPGYSFHVDNLIQTTIKPDQPFSLRRKYQNRAILIVYRSENRDNTNSENVIKIE